MIYVALDNIEMHIERVSARVDSGGHGATEGRLRQIHASSMVNFRRALAEFDYVDVYDNSGPGPQLVLVCEHGQVIWAKAHLPGWVRPALPLSS